MGVEIRTIQKDELPAWAEAIRVGFLGHVSEGEAEVMGGGRPTRSAAPPAPSTAPGRRHPAQLHDRAQRARRLVSSAALTNVTVTGTHRRQGLLTGMITRDLAESVERGEAVGALDRRRVPDLRPVRLRPRRRGRRAHRRRGGDVPRAPGRRLGRDGRAADVRSARAGALRGAPIRAAGRHRPFRLAVGRRARHPGLARPPREGPRFFVLGRDAEGQPDGFVTYHVEERWENERPKGVLHVEELIGRRRRWP